MLLEQRRQAMLELRLNGQNVIAYYCASYIRGFTVYHINMATSCERLELQVNRVFVHKFVETDNKETSTVRVNVPWGWESTCDC